jgi:lipoprotein-anchoring transpeptidase ErfK/SrfK
MNRFPITAALATLASLSFVSTALADDGYGTPPAMQSSDTGTSQPWLLRMLPGKARPVLDLPGVPQRVAFNAPGERRLAVQSRADPVMLAIPDDSQAAMDYPLDPEFMPQVVAYPSNEKPGTIVINTINRHLYLIMPNGEALRYGVGVGRTGFEWAGVHTITRMAEWPDWTPPTEMMHRVANLPSHMDGGVANPLGARALYLGSTPYRIHGSNEPWTIGHAVSSGCIRMRNQDIIDLYQRVRVGNKVMVI